MPPLPPFCRRTFFVWCLAALFRLGNVCLLRTYFSPDEYYQTHEVALHLASGGRTGHLTWEWRAGLRSALHPTLLALPLIAVQHVCAFLDSFAPFVPLALRNLTPTLLSTNLVLHFPIIVPRLIHVLLAAGTDVATWSLATRLFGEWGEDRWRDHALWAALIQGASWLNFFVLTRPLANTLEAFLLVFALAVWDEPLLTWHAWMEHIIMTIRPGRFTSRSKSRPKSPSPSPSPFYPVRVFSAMYLATLSCASRPPAIIPWFFLGLGVLCYRPRRALALLPTAVAAGIAGVTTIMVLDRWFYGTWTIPGLAFVHFNVGKGADYYGTHGWAWYLGEGTATVLATYMIPVCAALLLSSSSSASRSVSCKRSTSLAWSLCALYVAVCGVLSVARHKEFRFLLPAYQLLMPVVTEGMGRLWLQDSLHVHLMEDDEPQKKRCRRAEDNKDTDQGRVSLSWSRGTVILVLLGQVALTAFTSLVHRRGTLAAAAFITHHAAATSPSSSSSVYYLMPCHAAPGVAYHPTVTVVAYPDCSPPGHRPPTPFTYPPSVGGKGTSTIRVAEGEGAAGGDGPLTWRAWREAIHAEQLVGSHPSRDLDIEEDFVVDLDLESEEDRVLRHPGAFLRALGASSSIYALPTYVVMYGPVWAQLGGATGLSRRLGVKYNACATLMDSVIPTDHGATYTVHVACRLGAEKTAAEQPLLLGTP